MKHTKSPKNLPTLTKTGWIDDNSLRAGHIQKSHDAWRHDAVTLYHENGRYHISNVFAQVDFLPLSYNARNSTRDRRSNHGLDNTILLGTVTTHSLRLARQIFNAYSNKYTYRTEDETLPAEAIASDRW